MPVRVVVANDYDQMSEVAFELLHADLKAQLAIKDRYVLGLATGTSPVGLYKHFQYAANQWRIDPRRIRTFNLDEYVGLPGDNAQARTLHPASYSYFMTTELFGLLSRPFASIDLPLGCVIDQDELRSELRAHPDDWRERGGDSGRAIVISRKAHSSYLRWVRSEILDAYDRKIRAAGGIDLQVIGVGGRGHVAFHESGIPWSMSSTLLVRLDDNTVVNAVADGYFPSAQQVPRFATSMSAKQVFRARTVLLLAAGSRKVTPIMRSLLEPPSADVPISYGQQYAAAGGNLVYVVDYVVGKELIKHRRQLKERGVQILDRHRRGAKLRVADILFYRDIAGGCYRNR